MLTLAPAGSDGVLDDTPVLDISAAVTDSGERGFLGMTFSPDGTRLYVDYIDLNSDSNIDEYAVKVVLTRRGTAVADCTSGVMRPVHAAKSRKGMC